MKVHLQVAGGLVPALTSRKFVVDVANLPDEEARAIQALIERVLREPEPASVPRARDAMAYQLVVDRNGLSEVRTGSDGGLFVDFLELIRTIRSLASRR
jgi:hypothetical protein